MPDVGTEYKIDITAALASLTKLQQADAALRAAVVQGSQLQADRFAQAARQALLMQDAILGARREQQLANAIVAEQTAELRRMLAARRELQQQERKSTAVAEKERLTREISKSIAAEKQLRATIEESRLAAKQEAAAVAEQVEKRRQVVAQTKLQTAAQKDATAAAKQATTTQAPPATEPASGGFLGGLLGKVGPLAAGLFSINAIIGKIREGIGKAAETSSIQNTFNALTGSAQKGAKEVAYLKQQANALGLDLLPVAESYKGLFAAAKEANLSIDQTRDIFEAITTEGKVLGISNEKLESSLRAVQQMLSKGVVSSEELRGQLGEALPDATAIAARALGVNTQELDKMLRKGQIVSKDFLPKFAAEIKKTYGGALADASASLLADLNRINSFFSTSAAKIAGALAPAIQAFADLVAAPAKLSDATTQELTSLEDAAQRIRETNLGSAERVKLIKELQEQYPAYLGNLNAETVSNADLSKAIDSVTESLVNRLIVQEQDEKIAEQAKMTAKRRKEAIEEERKLRLALLEVQKQNENARLRDAKQSNGDLVPSLKEGLAGLPLNVQVEQVIDLTNKGNSGLVRTNSAYLRLVKTFQDYTFVQTLLAGQQQKANDLTNARRELLQALGIEEKKQLADTNDAQAKATQGFIDRLEAQKAALQKQKKELPGSFMDAGYRASINDFNTQIAEIDRQLDILNNKRDKSGESRENKLKAALEAVVREQQVYKELAEKAAVSVADEARAASERQLAADLAEIERAKQKLLDAELKAKGLGGKGALADGKLDKAQLDQANIQEEAVYKAHYDRLLTIARQQEDFLLSLKKDSNQKQLEELDIRFERELEKYRDQPALLAKVQEQYERERRALLNKQAQENINKGEAQATTLVEQAALEFQDPAKAERFKQQAILDVQIEFAQKRLALAKALNKVEGTSDTQKAVTDLENLIGNLSNNLQALQKEGKFDIYKFILGEKDDPEGKARAKLDAVVGASVNAIQQLLQADVAAQQARVDARTRNIDALNQQLNQEIQLYKGGAASNVTTLKEQIAEEKRARREAVAERRKVAREQIVIDTLLQSSSVITAAAQALTAFPIPFVGPALGILAASFVVGAFVASKVKAFQAVNTQTEGFYKGGYTGDGNPREESRAVGKKPYIYHKGEYVMPHDVTSQYRHPLLEPLHQGRPQDIDWHAPQMQALLPDYSLPGKLRAEQQAVIQHRMEHEFGPLQAQLQTQFKQMATELKQIKDHVARLPYEQYIPLPEESARVINLETRDRTTVRQG